jgi:hypothetical protein
MSFNLNLIITIVLEFMFKLNSSLYQILNLIYSEEFENNQVVENCENYWEDKLVTFIKQTMVFRIIVLIIDSITYRNLIITNFIVIVMFVRILNFITIIDFNCLLPIEIKTTNWF